MTYKNVPQFAAWLDTLFCLIPEHITAENLRDAFVKTGWQYGSKFDDTKQWPSIAQLHRQLNDTQGEWWVCGGMLYMQGKGHYVAADIWLNLNT